MNTSEGFNKEFTNRLRLLEVLYQMGAASGLLLGTKSSLEVLHDKKIASGETGKTIYDFNVLKNILSTTESSRIYLPEFNKYMTRSLVVTLYESFKGDITRYKIVENENWFKFLWVLRNCFAHGIEGIWKDIKEDFSYERKFDGVIISIRKDRNGSFATLSQIGSWLTFIDLLQTCIRKAEARE